MKLNSSQYENYHPISESFLSNLRKGHDVDDTEKIEKDCLAAVHDESEVNDFK